ncbi:MAG: hypothetical protein GX607_16315, partial [Myxococcales bacterium]|nr:hypothetical protein [Myxococcales bacterium]
MALGAGEAVADGGEVLGVELHGPSIPQGVSGSEPFGPLGRIRDVTEPNHSSAPAATTATTDPQLESEQFEQFRVRAAKREHLLEAGVEPYPVAVPTTHSIAEVREQWSDAFEPGVEDGGTRVGVSGRVMYLRNTGKLCFVTLQQAGATVQAMLSLAAVGEESLAAFKADVDLGDILFVHGHVGASRRGELSVFAEPGTDSETGEPVPAWQIAAKALRPLPKTYENEAGEQVALSEEGRVRRRHLDLILRPDALAAVR